jgi:hypothetical protein
MRWIFPVVPYKISQTLSPTLKILVPNTAYLPTRWLRSYEILSATQVPRISTLLSTLSHLVVHLDTSTSCAAFQNRENNLRGTGEGGKMYNKPPRA